MTRATIIRYGIAAMLLGGIGAAPAQDKVTDKDKSSNRESSISVQVADLEKQNAELTKRNRDLEKQIQQLQVELASAKIVVPPKTKTVPDSWQEKNFNGITYYVVPLDGGQKATVIAK